MITVSTSPSMPLDLSLRPRGRPKSTPDLSKVSPIQRKGRPPTLSKSIIGSFPINTVESSTPKPRGRPPTRNRTTNVDLQSPMSNTVVTPLVVQKNTISNTISASLSASTIESLTPKGKGSPRKINATPGSYLFAYNLLNNIVKST